MYIPFSLQVEHLFFFLKLEVVSFFLSVVRRYLTKFLWSIWDLVSSSVAVPCVAVIIHIANLVFFLFWMCYFDSLTLHYQLL